MTKSNLPTVIIPAYNEETVIGRLLMKLQSGVANNSFQVIVACNGCNDNTASLVRTRFPQYMCLDITEGSKIRALNQAEELSLGFPRIYIDADVCISSESVCELISQSNSLHEPALHAPRATINTEQSSIWVRAFYAAWQKTAYFVDRGFGSGVYVLNQAAREKFVAFPNVIADDGYVREMLSKDQVFVCEAASSVVEAPRTLGDLIKIKTRSKLGNMQLRRLGLTQSSPDVECRCVRKMTLCESLIYFFVNAVAQVLARTRVHSLDGYTWQRDNSSRG